MPNSANHSDYLAPGRFVDSDHPAVITFAKGAAGGQLTKREQAVRLFYAVRDTIRYDPYLPMGREESYRASDALRTRRGWCVPKAALLAACARVLGIPARCGYADVKNHLASRNLLESMGTDTFYWHSYTEFYLEGRWVKATPTFNQSLCDKFGIHPLEFDGLSDSLFHEFDRDGKRHMEYVRFRGTYADVPFTAIVETFKQKYPGLAGHLDDGLSGDFEAEADAGQTE